MFEKESKEYANKWLEHVKDLELQHKTDDKPEYIRIEEAHQKGAEFGYNFAKEEIDYLNKHWRSEEERKANEWHEIESKVTPKREISKQYMPKNKEKVLLKYHFSGDDEVHISDGYYDAYDFEFHIANNPKYRIVCVIAWKELPKEINK
jgi:hypothetical protein